MRMDQGGQRPNSPWGDNAKFEELNRLHKMEKKSLQDEIWRLQRQLDQCTGEGELGNNSFISRFQKTGNYVIVYLTLEWPTNSPNRIGAQSPHYLEIQR